MDPTLSADQVGRLARRLTAAERAVRARRARDVSRGWVTAGRIADIVAVVAFLMPWAVDGTGALRGYRLSPQLTTCLLLAVVLRQIVLTVSLARPDARSRGAIVAIHVGGLLGVAVGVPAIGPDATHRIVTGAVEHPASLVFLVAIVAATVCGIRAADAIRDSLVHVDLLDGLHHPTAAAVGELLEDAIDDALAAPGVEVQQPVAPALLSDQAHPARAPHTGRAAPNRPRMRLGRATFVLAVVAFLCTRLAWVLPATRTDTLAFASPGDAPVPSVLALVTLVVAGRLALDVSRPSRSKVVAVLAAAVAALSLATSLTALAELGSVRYAAGPAGWLSIGVFGGVAALALFTASTVYESWRECSRGSAELALAAARLETAIRPRRMW